MLYARERARVVRFIIISISARNTAAIPRRERVLTCRALIVPRFFISVNPPLDTSSKLASVELGQFRPTFVVYSRRVHSRENADGGAEGGGGGERGMPRIRYHKPTRTYSGANCRCLFPRAV